MKRQLLSLLKRVASKRALEKNNYYDWLSKARESQLPPTGDWDTWLIMAGRGFGKTRSGAETIRAWVKQGLYKRIALIGQNLNEVRSILVEGKSGLLSISPPEERPEFKPSKRCLIWPNGAMATLYGADFYEKLRGPEFDCAWVDELAKFRHASEFWDQLMLCLRLGKHPRCIITTTPKPIALFNTLLKDQKVTVTKGSTFDNQENLPKSFLNKITKQYEGTRLGQQELHAQLLAHQEGALWSQEIICYQPQENKPWQRVVIAIDPATTHHEQSDETGIIVAALSRDKKVYILDDLSGRFPPVEWGTKVLEAYQSYQADRVVAEVNKGGDLVERLLKTLAPHIAYVPVRATRGKYTRAEPIAALYEQKKVFHIKPFPLLEEQMRTFVPGISKKSPDRMDALVWAVTSLMLENEQRPNLKLWHY